jgi:hypothetical protein
VRKYPITTSGVQKIQNTHFNKLPFIRGRRDSDTSCQLRGWSSSPGTFKELSLLHSVRTRSEVHPASCPIGTGDNATGKCSWPLACKYYWPALKRQSEYAAIVRAVCAELETAHTYMRCRVVGITCVVCWRQHRPQAAVSTRLSAAPRIASRCRATSVFYTLANTGGIHGESSLTIDSVKPYCKAD